MVARDSFAVGVAGGAVGVPWVARAEFTIVLKQPECEYFVVPKRAAGGGVCAGTPPTTTPERFFTLTDRRSRISGFLPDYNTTAKALWAEVLGDPGMGLHPVAAADTHKRKQPIVYACEPAAVGRLKTTVHKLEVCWWSLAGACGLVVMHLARIFAGMGQYAKARFRYVRAGCRPIECCAVERNRPGSCPADSSLGCAVRIVVSLVG